MTSGRFSFFSPCPQRIEEKHMQVHRERVESAAAVVDTHGKEVTHSPDRKRLEAQAERQYDIDRVSPAAAAQPLL